MTNEETRTSENMTMEETIDTLKGLVFGTFDRTTAKEREALDMAIKALEQQPCEDCISRQAVLRLVEQYPSIIGNRCVGLMADIKHLPQSHQLFQKRKQLRIV